MQAEVLDARQCLLEIELAKAVALHADNEAAERIGAVLGRAGGGLLAGICSVAETHSGDGGAGLQELAARQQVGGIHGFLPVKIARQGCDSVLGNMPDVRRQARRRSGSGLLLALLNLRENIANVLAGGKLPVLG